MTETELVDFAVEYAQKKGATYAEARYEQQASETVVLKNGVVDALNYGDDAGVGVRVLAGGSLGFSATNLMTKTDVRAIVDNAVRIAKIGRASCRERV